MILGYYIFNGKCRIELLSQSKPEFSRRFGVFHISIYIPMHFKLCLYTVPNSFLPGVEKGERALEICSEKQSLSVLSMPFLGFSRWGRTGWRPHSSWCHHLCSRRAAASSQPSADFCRDLLSPSYFQGLVISLFYFTFLMSTI